MGSCTELPPEGLYQSEYVIVSMSCARVDDNRVASINIMAVFMPLKRRRMAVGGLRNGLIEI